MVNFINYWSTMLMLQIESLFGPGFWQLMRFMPFFGRAMQSQLMGRPLLLISAVSSLFFLWRSNQRLKKKALNPRQES